MQVNQFSYQKSVNVKGRRAVAKDRKFQGQKALWLMAFVAMLVWLAIGAAHARGTPEGFADLVEKLSPAVVNISAEKAVGGGENDGEAGPPNALPPNGLPPGLEDFFRRFGVPPNFGLGPEGRGGPRRHANSLGTGFIIDGREGIVITNNHVVEDGDTIFVILQDGTQYDAELIGTDERTDIAVLKIEPKGTLPELRFGNSDEARIGDWVLAIGNPHGLGGTVTAGIISARGRDIGAGPYDDFIQTDAPINPGNSGGPLFNMKGEVIGINTAIISGGNGGSIGIGFAIPSAQAQPVIQQLQDFGETRRGWLGVEIQTISDDIAASLGLDEAKGAMIARVVEGGPAEAAGFEAGDVILRFNGQDIETSRDLSRIVADTKVGATVKVEIFRKGKSRNLNVTLGRLETANLDGTPATDEDEDQKTDEADKYSKLDKELGLALTPLDKQLRARYEIPPTISGLFVRAVRNDSDAQRKGIRAGAVISEINQTSIDTMEAAKAQIEAAKRAGRDVVLLRVVDQNGNRYVAVKLALDE